MYIYIYIYIIQNKLTYNETRGHLRHRLDYVAAEFRVFFVFLPALFSTWSRRVTPRAAPALLAKAVD